MTDLTFDPATHVYRLRGAEIPSVAQILREAGLIDPTVYKKGSAEKGVALHATTQLYDEGGLAGLVVHPDVQPYFEGWIKFRRENPQFVFTAIEVPVASEMYRFAGTPDRVGTINKSMCIVEIKSGSTPWWVGLQTAGQSLLVERNVVASRWCVTLPGDGNYKLDELTDYHDRDLFVSALNICRLRRTHGLIKEAGHAN